MTATGLWTASARDAVPPAAPGGLALALRSYGYWVAQYRRTWRGSVVSSVVGPVLYLAALGVGLGTLVDKHGAVRIGGVSYLSFVAPGLLAATAMQTAVAESTWTVLGAIKWVRTYFGMLATPLRVSDVLVGHLLWVATRVASTSVIYFAVLAAFGSLHSGYAVLALPATLLTGMAFACPVMAFAARCERDTGFSVLYRFGVMPLFLFSGTFYPLTQLPVWLRDIAYVTPLWHGVDLCRGFTLGDVSWSAAALHVAYLSVWVAAGLLAARSSFQRRLVV